MTAAGGFLQTTLRHTYPNRSGISLIVSIDTYRRNDVLREARNTLSVDFHHNLVGPTGSSSFGDLSVRTPTLTPTRIGVLVLPWAPRAST
jgi:hypothetical protein